MVDAGLCLKETIKRNRPNLVKENSLELTDNELTYKIYKCVDDCEEYWSCIRCEDPFFSPEYFKILEQRTMNAVKPLYCFVFIKDEAEPISMYFMQKKRLRLTDSIDIEKFKEGKSTWAYVKNFLQRTFFDAKADEIEQLYTGGQSVKITDLVDLLNRVSPNNSSKWKNIKF